MSGLSEPKWLELARDCVGIHEIKGPKHQGEILRMAQDAKLSWIRDDETAWCSIFVCAMVERAGLRSTRSAGARSWMHWGIDCLSLGREQIPLGAIVVYDRPPDPTHGHVGFAVGITAEGSLMTLGGNQSDAVSIAPFKSSRVIAARWPHEERSDLLLLRRIPFLSSSRPLSTNEA